VDSGVFGIALLYKQQLVKYRYLLKKLHYVTFITLMSKLTIRNDLQSYGVGNILMVISVEDSDGIWIGKFL
jgi:hypothetical protein